MYGLVNMNKQNYEKLFKQEFEPGSLVLEHDINHDAIFESRLASF